MASTLGTLPPDPTDPGTNYRPISGVAVAAIFVSGLFAATVTVLGLTALVTHRPALAPWVLVLGVAGLILSVAARFQIRRSEGTRVGQGLANAAWWLSILFTVGYGAYYAAFDYAVRNQSRAECIEPYLAALSDSGNPNKTPKEREDALKRAFMWTLQPGQRQGLKPENVEDRFSQAFGTYLNTELVRLMERAGGEVRLDNVAVHKWDPKGTGYEVEEFVTVSTPEGRFDLVFTLLGNESQGTAGRQWNVVPLPSSPIRSAEPTALGAHIISLVGAAQQTAQQWQRTLVSGDKQNAFPMVLSPEHRDQIHKEGGVRKAQVRVVHQAAYLADPIHLYSNILWPPNGISAEAVNPGYFRFLNGLRPDGKPWITIPKEVASEAQYEEMARQLLLPGGITLGGGGTGGPPAQPYPTLSAEAFSVRVPILCSLASRQTSARLAGWLVVETRDPTVVKEMNSLRAQGLALPLLTASTMPPQLPKAAWQIRQMVLFEEVGGPATPQQPPPMQAQGLPQ